MHIPLMSLNNDAIFYLLLFIVHKYFNGV